MKKYKIGYTTGVFDLFHIGHLNILKKAKEQCDYLIVGISIDKLVKEYKGRIPVIPYEERKQIVEAIKYVDEVIPQITMDKYEAWKSKHFDVMFHGDDWKNSELYKENEKKLKTVGVNFVYFPYTKTTSSSMVKTVLNEKLGEKK